MEVHPTLGRMSAPAPVVAACLARIDQHESYVPGEKRVAFHGWGGLPQWCPPPPIYRPLPVPPPPFGWRPYPIPVPPPYLPPPMPYPYPPPMPMPYPPPPYGYPMPPPYRMPPPFAPPPYLM